MNIAEHYPDIKLRYIKYDNNDEEATHLFNHYDIRTVPAVLFTKCGGVIDSYSDVAPLDEYRKSFKHLHENDGD